MFARKAPVVRTHEPAPPGRAEPLRATNRHFVLGAPLKPPFPADSKRALFGMGCFWDAERLFWQQPGVYTTAAGYAGGHTENPTYREVCSGVTGHAEVVLVVYNPSVLAYATLLAIFWQSHDATSSKRPLAGVGEQYRSALYCFDRRQIDLAKASRDHYQAQLDARGLGRITTEIATAPPFYYAEDEHQQYLAKHPCGARRLGDGGLPYAPSAAR